MIRIDDILEKVSSTFPERDINLIKKAYVFAAQAHQGQVRRSGEPYLSHPLEVAEMLADMKMDKTTIAASLLHDVLEDTNITPGELRKAFGKEISLLVEGVTKLSRVEEASPLTRHFGLSLSNWPTGYTTLKRSSFYPRTSANRSQRKRWTSMPL